MRLKPRVRACRVAVSVLALVATALPRFALPVALPLATVGCNCQDDGSAVAFDRATTERSPQLVVTGDACSARSLECMHRDDADRCDVFWIVPERPGHCVFTARFDDGTAMEAAFDYEFDGEWPCRGSIRPHDGGRVVRFNSGSAR